MRERKFRAWNENNNVMEKVWSIFWYDDKLMIDIYGIGNRQETARPIDDFIIMEYIGLKDKNKEDIYEEDIIKNDWTDNIYVINDIRDVKWLLVDGFLAGQESQDGKSLIGVKIIGDKYNNPELLEEE